jgi:hypothetical protein
LEDFHSKLSDRVAEWNELNYDPDFIEWIKQEDEATGEAYGAVLNRAYHARKVAATARVFETYLSEQSTGKQKATTQNKRETPEHLVAPSRKGGGLQTRIDNAGTDGVMRMSDYEDFVRQVRDGIIKEGSPAYREKKSAFLKANAEGRLL